jgi:hypothetical protein
MKQFEVLFAVCVASLTLNLSTIPTVFAECYPGLECPTVATPEKPPINDKPVPRKPVQPKRPDPSKYSQQFWPYGSIPEGELRTALTKYGQLSCRGASRLGVHRLCWWN